MAKNVFNPENNYKIQLLGHILQPNAAPIEVHGHFDADTVEFDDELGGEREFAVFNVDEPENQEYPHRQVGKYRIAMGELMQNYKSLLFPEPEPEEDPA